jgi:hypothetical protein
MADKKPPVRRPPSRFSAAAPWIAIAMVGGIVVGVLARGGPGAPSHPEPRPDARDAAAGVMPASFFASTPRIMSAYQAAREIPETLDGLYCHCQCKEHHGHRSLLICFHSQHGAGCDICVEEAVLAHQMVREGRSLADIRTAIDVAFGR